MSTEKVEALIRTHVQRYSKIEILDIYKLLHQATFGPGHAIKNQKAAREWLERESELLKPISAEPLIENIHPNGEIVRVHLRPYIAARGNPNKLLDGLVASSKAVTGDPAQMAAWWAIFQGMIAENGSLVGRFDSRTAALEGRTRVSEQWPANHHSPLYDQTYNPHYRVLTHRFAVDLLNQQKIAFTVI